MRCLPERPGRRGRLSRRELGGATVLVRLTTQARDELRHDEALVFDWHRVAICCAVAGEISLRRVPWDRIASVGAYRRLPADPPAPVYAHRLAYPHLAGRDIAVDCRRRLGMRQFRSDLPTDFGLRTALGRVPDQPAGEGSRS